MCEKAEIIHGIKFGENIFTVGKKVKINLKSGDTYDGILSNFGDSIFDLYVTEVCNFENQHKIRTTVILSINSVAGIFNMEEISQS